MPADELIGIRSTPQPGRLAGWNPRFARYARANGCKSIAELDRFLKDQETRWPGGKTAGFSIWILQRWEQFGMEVVGRRDRGAIHLMLGADSQRMFDIWLDSKYPFPE